jgi:L-erythro-3,5-diaminohexanoate dehydrogenase
MMRKKIEVKPSEHLGLHRVIAPQGALPQQAEKLNPELPISGSELLISVDQLNVDSASFHQFMAASGGSPELACEKILAVVRERGKLQNPVTGSGGMLIGSVAEVGPFITNPDLMQLKVGDRVASLVSLTLTPLKIRKVKAIRPKMERIDIEGHAIIFNSGMAAKIPEDISEGVALAALDVCGAPAQTAHLVKPGMNVVVIGGGGKSGLLCLYEAKKQIGHSGQVIAFDYSAENCQRLRGLNFIDKVIQGDARNAVATSEAVRTALGGEAADLCINVANIEGTEMASILSTKNGGTVYFFSMATRFSAAALGAEGVGADVNLMIGNGYTKGHAAHTMNMLRESAVLRKIFEDAYEA